MNRSTFLSELPPNTVINKTQVKNWKLDKALLGLKAEDWANPEATADHFVSYIATQKQATNGDKLYDRYVKDIRSIIISGTAKTVLRLYAEETYKKIGQEEFKQKFLDRYNAQTARLGKRSASAMLEEGEIVVEEEEEEEEEEEITPSEASASLLATNMSVDEANSAIEGQAIPTELTYNAVKTVMFQRAQYYFVLYQARKKALNSQQRKLMSCGSSLILDLVDQSDGNGFKKLFSTDQWNTLRTKFTQECKIQGGAPWSDTLQAYWEGATSRVSPVVQFSTSKQFISNLLKDPLPTPTSDALELMRTVFDVSEYAQRSRIIEKASDNDILFQLWLPVLKNLFPGPFVKLKIGETVNSATTECKMLLFPGESNITGFKTDIRFLVQIDGTFDLASGEACLILPGESKLLDDHAKLMREAKCSATALHEVTAGKISHSWMVQFIGLQAIFSTVTYSDHNLHVATHQETVTLPHSVSSFENTQDTTKFINTLLNFQFDLEKTAHTIQDTIDETNRALRQENFSELMEYESPRYQAPPSAMSFFTPPRGDLSRAQFPIANQAALASGAEVVIQTVQEATTTEG